MNFGHPIRLGNEEIIVLMSGYNRNSNRFPSRSVDSQAGRRICRGNCVLMPVDQQIEIPVLIAPIQQSFNQQFAGMHRAACRRLIPASAQPFKVRRNSSINHRIDWSAGGATAQRLASFSRWPLIGRSSTCRPFFADQRVDIL